MKQSQILWFANYSELSQSQRTTEVKVFRTLKAANAFMSNRYGYIVRQGKDTTVHGYVNGFTPSAAEQIKINAIGQF